jgi:predicted phage-related endonuclease
MNAPDRQHFLGGSDAAAVLGVSPWHTPLDLYLIKTGEKPPVVDPFREKLFRRGKRLEPVVIDMLIEELGLKVTKRSTPEQPNRYQDPLEPYLAAEIDFEWEVTPAVAERFDLPADLVGTIQNGEVKTVHPFASHAFGEAETDEIPVEYAAQAMHGLMVSGRQLTLFGVLVGADNLIPYFIRRDDDTIRGMREQELDFWHGHVLARVPPKPVNLPDVLELFHRVPASRVVATPEIAEKVTQFKANRIEMNRLAAVDEELRYLIGVHMLGETGVLRTEDGSVRPASDVPMGVHELRFDGAPILLLKKQSQTRIDSDLVREKHPAVAPSARRRCRSSSFPIPPSRKHPQGGSHERPSS